MNREILATKNIEQNGFIFTLNLYSFADCGMSEFNSKWVRDEDGLVESDGERFDCTYYRIGKLKDGADVTPYMAKKEFNRDRYAFDVHLFISVYRNDVELIEDEPLIGGDYNYDDGETSECLEWLAEHFDINEWTEKANEQLEEIRKALA